MWGGGPEIRIMGEKGGRELRIRAEGGPELGWGNWKNEKKSDGKNPMGKSIYWLPGVRRYIEILTRPPPTLPCSCVIPWAREQ